MLRSACVAVPLAALTARDPSLADGRDGSDAAAPRACGCRRLVPGDRTWPGNDSEAVDHDRWSPRLPAAEWQAGNRRATRRATCWARAPR